MATWAGDGGSGRGARRCPRIRRDVFPGLEAFIWVGGLLGLLSAVAVAGLQRRLDGDLLNLAGMGTGLGAVLGLFVGLGRGAWRPGPPIYPRESDSPAVPMLAPPPQLWDPWLDTGRDVEPADAEPAAEEPVCAEPPEVLAVERAPVRPRVISPETAEAIRLDDEIGPMIETDRGRLVVIEGGPGSGKTTALRHLAAVLPPWAGDRIRLLEKMDLGAIASAGPNPIVILTRDTSLRPNPADLAATLMEREAVKGLLATSPGLGRCEYRLAPWDRDDAIEYLLATHRTACASVMGRSGDLDFLDGIPELCSVVLDRMASDEAIVGVRQALSQELRARIDAQSIQWKRIQDRVLEAFRTDSHPPRPPEALIARILCSSPDDGAGVGSEGGFARLIRHRPAALLLAADRVAAIIEGGRPTSVLARSYPRELVREVARRIADSPAAVEHLAAWMRSPRLSERPFAGASARQAIQPLAASLLHAATPGWRPDPGSRPRLEGAFLDGVVWPEWQLERGRLRGAEFRDAELRGANLEGADVRGACFRGANLRRAKLRQWLANGADLARADLWSVRAQQARLRGANLSGALLGAARLWKADLTGARIDRADFSGANLEDARLEGLSLRLARFDGARFGGARLRGCDMEEMSLAAADFHDADLRGAVLTGTRMPGANFRGANLRGARLAEIDWPGACLRDADLRAVNFHLGSTRSGLIDSPIACEGSRTGFYTDDFLDRDVKPAEEIRKANLRGADLRGANLQDVDFYLVDLREARYTATQARHLRRCRAILDRTS